MSRREQQEFVGAASECAVSTWGREAALNEVSPLEQRVFWVQDDYSGSVIDVTLRSGLQLCLFEGRAERAVSVPVSGAPTALMLTLSRGAGAMLSVDGGAPLKTGGGALEVTQVKRSATLFSTIEQGCHNEYVILTLEPAMFCSLLGVEELPRAVTDVLESDEAYCRQAMPMGVELYRLMDEMLERSADGLSRQLYLEGKAFELLAKIYDQLIAIQHGTTCADLPADVERLQQAKRLLQKKLDAPPTLHDLARQVGLSPTHLKTGFRKLFGAPLYSYLRSQRMIEAYRLLCESGLSVTEVSFTVGYANPSKFSAAFRKQFGMSPSSLTNSRSSGS